MCVHTEVNIKIYFFANIMSKIYDAVHVGKTQNKIK